MKILFFVLTLGAAMSLATPAHAQSSYHLGNYSFTGSNSSSQSYTGYLGGNYSFSQSSGSSSHSGYSGNYSFGSAMTRPSTPSTPVSSPTAKPLAAAMPEAAKPPAATTKPGSEPQAQPEEKKTCVQSVREAYQNGEELSKRIAAVATPNSGSSSVNVEHAPTTALMAEHPESGPYSLPNDSTDLNAAMAFAPVDQAIGALLGKHCLNWFDSQDDASKNKAPQSAPPPATSSPQH